jgi:hypothetical protein
LPKDLTALSSPSLLLPANRLIFAAKLDDANLIPFGFDRAEPRPELLAIQTDRAGKSRIETGG